MQNPNTEANLVVVTPKSADTPSSIPTVVTPGDAPNVTVKVMPMWKILAIKSAKVYFDTLVAVLGGDASLQGLSYILNSLNVSNAQLAIPLPPGVPLFGAALLYALGPALSTLVRNIATYFTALEQKLPALSA